MKSLGTSFLSVLLLVRCRHSRQRLRRRRRTLHKKPFQGNWDYTRFLPRTRMGNSNRQTAQLYNWAKQDTAFEPTCRSDGPPVTKSTSTSGGRTAFGPPPAAGAAMGAASGAALGAIAEMRAKAQLPRRSQCRQLVSRARQHVAMVNTLP